MNEKKITKIVIDDTTYETQVNKKYQSRKQYTPPDPKKVTAFIPGIIQNLVVKTGQKVKRGDALYVLEAMKMKNAVTAHTDGKIKQVFIKEGEMVAKGKVLVEFE